jgi:hypothetical protein
VKVPAKIDDQQAMTSYLASERDHFGDLGYIPGVNLFTENHASEKGFSASPIVRPVTADLTAYYQSERARTSSSSLTAYHLSEWNRNVTPLVRPVTADLAAYYQSERSRIKVSPLNAYQCSEWLGADR